MASATIWHKIPRRIDPLSGEPSGTPVTRGVSLISAWCSLGRRRWPTLSATMAALRSPGTAKWRRLDSEKVEGGVRPDQVDLDDTALDVPAAQLFDDVVGKNLLLEGRFPQGTPQDTAFPRREVLFQPPR